MSNLLTAVITLSSMLVATLGITFWLVPKRADKPNKMRKVSTHFSYTADTYYMRVFNSKRGERMFIIHNSLGNIIGVSLGEYEPKRGTHLLEHPFHISDTDYNFLYRKWVTPNE